MLLQLYLIIRYMHVTVWNLAETMAIVYTWQQRTNHNYRSKNLEQIITVFDWSRFFPYMNQVYSSQKYYYYYYSSKKT